MSMIGSEMVGQCLVAVDALKEMVNGAKRSWIRSDAVTINARDLLEQVELLRKSLPEAVTQAGAIVSQEAEITANAKQAADAAVAQAKAEAEKLVADAQAKVKELEGQMAQAQAETERIRQDNVKLAQDGAKKAQDEAGAIVAHAHEEAARLVNLGEQRAMELVKEEAVFQRAEVHAKELVEAANAEAEQLRQKTFGYLDSVLGKVEEYAGNLMADIHDQRDSLSSRNR